LASKSSSTIYLFASRFQRLFFECFLVFMSSNGPKSIPHANIDVIFTPKDLKIRPI